MGIRKTLGDWAAVEFLKARIRSMKPMERIEYRDIADRTTGRLDYDTGKIAGWPSGPWDDEPDKVQWQDEVTKYPCLIVRGPVGSWCGYVGVSEGHKLHGCDYDDASDLNVHGGITFAAPCQERDDHHGICHIPGPGEPDNVWWIGFDCCHAGDYAPAMRPIPGLRNPEVYRDMAYVTEQVQVLALQLKAMEAT